MQSVSITNESLTHIFKIFLIGTFRFELRTQMLNATMYILFENSTNEVNTNKSSRNNRKKKIRLALFYSIILVTILVKVSVDTPFYEGEYPSPYNHSTPAAYLTLGLGCHAIETN